MADRFVAAVDIEEIDCGESITCGFRQHWVDGSYPNGREFSVGCGAGLGSKWITVSTGEGDGGTARYYRMSVETILRAIERHEESDSSSAKEASDGGA